MKKKQFLFIFLLIPALIMASESVENAEKKISKLNSLIIEAKSKGLDVQREELAVWMSKTFLGYAAWDEKNIEPNVYQFRAWPAYKKDAEKMAAERNGSELRHQPAGCLCPFKVVLQLYFCPLWFLCFWPQRGTDIDTLLTFFARLAFIFVHIGLLLMAAALLK